MLGEEMTVAETESIRASRANSGPVLPSTISRHRRIHKEVGAITGISFIDAPLGDGVVVSNLKADGACAKAGVRVGDHIKKINGEIVTNQKQAVAQCDAAWTVEADGSDKNKDRLKFSLHRRTQDFSIGREGSGLVASAGMVGVEVFGAGSAKKSLLGTSKNKLQEPGMVLEDSPAGFGAYISEVTAELPAHIAGLDAGLTIVSVDGVLCPAGHADVLKMIQTARANNGVANIVCHLKKDKDKDKDED